MTDSQAQHRTVYLADYRPPDFSIDSVDLHFTLDEATTRVHSRMAVRRLTNFTTTSARLARASALKRRAAPQPSRPIKPGSPFHREAV